jgi:hypothetical protein
MRAGKVNVFGGKKKVDKLFVPLGPIGRISVTLQTTSHKREEGKPSRDMYFQDCT